MSRSRSRPTGWIACKIAGAAVLAIATTLSTVSAATNWNSPLNAGSRGEAASRAAITTAYTNPATFSAACGSGEAGVLNWTSAGPAVTGYSVYESSTVNGTFALATSQPAGVALTVTETYSAATGNKFYRLEAMSSGWPFPGTTITNARQASVLGTVGGWLTMASTGGTRCSATP